MFCIEIGSLLSFVYFLVRWHAIAVNFPLNDVILAQLACPLIDIMFYLHAGITNLHLYNIGLNNVCIETGLLLSFVYFFGQVA